MGWHPFDLVSEALRNVAAGSRRSVLVVLVVALATGGTTAAELWQVGGIAAMELDREARGEYVVIVRDEAGLEPGRCQSVAASSGVERTGGARLVDPIEMAQAPGLLVQSAIVDADVVRIWTGRPAPVAPNQAIVGSDLAAELGLIDGSLVLLGPTPVEVAVVDVSARYPAASRWLMFVAPTARPDECWVALAPGVDEAAHEMLAAHFWADGAGVSVHSLWSPTDPGSQPPALFAQRATQHLWLPAAGVVILVLIIVTWTRRREIGLYRALGTSMSELLLIGLVETYVVALAGAVLGWVWAVSSYASFSEAEFGLDVVFTATRSAASALGLVMVASPLAWCLWRGDGIVEQLKAD